MEVGAQKRVVVERLIIRVICNFKKSFFDKLGLFSMLWKHILNSFSSIFGNHKQYVYFFHNHAVGYQGTTEKNGQGKFW